MRDVLADAGTSRCHGDQTVFGKNVSNTRPERDNRLCSTRLHEPLPKRYTEWTSERPMSDLGIRRTPYSIPDNTEPFPEDRMSWAMEQIPHTTFQENCLLLFLARHSWGRYTKQGDDLIGYVRPEWASVRRIAEQIGKPPTSVYRALAGLRDKGYVSIAANRTLSGSEPSDIKIWFFESDDIMREGVRDHSRVIPEIFLPETARA